MISLINQERDIYFMQQALMLAKKAAFNHEVPVGAVLVLEDRMIGEGHNASITLNDPSAHAEMIALRRASNHLKNYRLINTTLYVTLEPCMMCAGALVHARIKRLVFGASDPKAGVVHSQGCLLDAKFLNHRIDYHGGVLAHDCGALLSEFFASKRS